MDYCVVCGGYVQEGSLVCVNCLKCNNYEEAGINK